MFTSLLKTALRAVIVFCWEFAGLCKLPKDQNLAFFGYLYEIPPIMIEAIPLCGIALSRLYSK
jgi:hypothetical protein